MCYLEQQQIIDGFAAHYGQSSISIFQKFSASIDNIFSLGGRLGIRV